MKDRGKTKAMREIQKIAAPPPEKKKVPLWRRIQDVFAGIELERKEPDPNAKHLADALDEMSHLRRKIRGAAEILETMTEQCVVCHVCHHCKRKTSCPIHRALTVLGRKL